MSVQSQINRIVGNISSAYSAVSGKGGTLPSSRNSANLPAAIQSIPQTSVTSFTATANGTYTAPSGTAYSPVVVSLPTYDGSVT